VQKTEKKTIGGTTYHVSQFGALKGREILFHLTKFLGPATSGYVAGDDIAASLGLALQTWCEKANKDDFILLCTAFAEVTKYEQPLTSGEVIHVELSKTFDSHFAGHYGYMLAWLAFAIQVNFASFLSEIGSELGATLAAIGIRMQQKSESRPE
jgi:hypothetical protein